MGPAKKLSKRAFVKQIIGPNEQARREAVLQIDPDLAHAVKPEKLWVPLAKMLFDGIDEVRERAAWGLLLIIDELKPIPGKIFPGRC